MPNNSDTAFDTHDKIVAFGWVLYRCHAITEVSTMISYMEKPWKWQHEYDVYQELGGKADEATINAMAKRFG